MLTPQARLYLGLMSTLFILGAIDELTGHEKFKALTVFESSDAGDPLLGDGFGTTVRLQDPFVIVSAPNATIDGAPGAGAVYVYETDLKKKWELIQVISSAGANDHVGGMQVDLSDNLLFVSAVGTPLEPIPHETIENQDFSGSVLVHKVNRRLEEGEQWWIPIQTLDKKTPGLHELTDTSLEALRSIEPSTKHQKGAHFGLQMSYDPEGQWLMVGAPNQMNTDIHGKELHNSGAVYLFRLDDRGGFKFVQKIMNPKKVSSHDHFGANVRVYGRFALISNSPAFDAPLLDKNGTVYLYHYEKGEWVFTQKLRGHQHKPNHVHTAYGARHIGDGFGSSLALNDEWAVVGAGLESKGKGEPLSGAVYFYQFVNGDVWQHLKLQHKAFSDDHTTQGTALSHVAIRGNTVLVSDPLRTGPKGKHQGGALVFEKGKKGWKQTGVIYDPKGQAGDFFGYSVALSRSHALVGSSTFGLRLLTHYGNPQLQLPAPAHKGKAIFFKQK